MRIIQATGPVAEALRRYDPDMDIRYSWERQCWAIAFRTRRPDLIPPPVRSTVTAAGFVDTLLPEKSEAYISYRTKTYPAAYVKRLSWHTFDRVIASDTVFRGSVRKHLLGLKEAREKEERRLRLDRYKEARTYMNWHARTHPAYD